jgi:hypothetical protein
VHFLSRELTLQRSPTLALVPSLKRTPARRPIARLEDRGIEAPEVVGEVVTNLSLQTAVMICPVVVKGHRLHLVEELAGRFVSAVD